MMIVKPFDCLKTTCSFIRFIFLFPASNFIVTGDTIPQPTIPARDYSVFLRHRSVQFLTMSRDEIRIMLDRVQQPLLRLRVVLRHVLALDAARCSVAVAAVFILSSFYWHKIGKSPWCRPRQSEFWRL